MHLNRLLSTLALAVAMVLVGTALYGQGDTSRPAKRQVPFILDTLEIVRNEVFDTTGSLGGLMSLLNMFHTVTQEDVIADEIFLQPGDTVSQADLEELERNMRTREIFSTVLFEIIPLEGEEGQKVPWAKLRVVTRDSWSLRASGSFYIGPNETSYTLSAREINLFGFGQQVGVTADYTSINDRQWRFGTNYLNQNISGTHYRLAVSVGASRFDKTGFVTFGRPFYSDRVGSAFNVLTAYGDGDEFYYLHGFPNNRFATHTERADLSGWYSSSKLGIEGGVFRWSLAANVNRAEYDSIPPRPRAFDNSVGIFGGISSMRRSYVHLKNVDFSGDRQVPLGASGSVSIGKITPHNGGLDNTAYVGADARQAGMLGKLYLFGAVSAGTGLAERKARFTIQKFLGTAMLRIDPGVVAMRLEQSTVWNWPRYIFQPVDNRSGLRGYDIFQFFGDNRILFNLEYRLNPLFTLLGHEIGAAAFYDVGGVWNQGDQIGKTRFYNTAGIGFRLSTAKGQFNRGLLRVDIAYNFEQKKLAKLIIGSQESFDAFGTIDYSPPGPITP